MLKYRGCYIIKHGLLLLLDHFLHKVFFLINEYFQLVNFNLFFF